jgi:hypothetical protein
MIDDEILDHLRAQGCQKRQHASFFTWHDRSALGRGIAEAGVVADLLGAMEAQGLAVYRSLGASGEEWPDVWLQAPDGTRVPCEVTELVDKAALPAGPSRPWTADELVSRVQERISNKATRSIGGSTGVQSILVIHTDEEYLNADNVSVMLTGIHFTKPRTIRRIFLLLSYDPSRGGYRYVELELAA